MDLGRPENVELLFRRGQRLGRLAFPPLGGGFRTAIDRYCDLVTINVFYKNSRVKQYLKDGALAWRQRRAQSQKACGARPCRAVGLTVVC